MVNSSLNSKRENLAAVEIAFSSNKNNLLTLILSNALGLDNQAIGYNEFRPLAHGIFPPMHLQAFTTQNITHFLLRANFEVKDISTPGNFDIDIINS